MNKVILIGNITKKPENMATANGTSCTKFTLAVNRNYIKEDGTRDTDFINCVSWRKLADTIFKYCDKGSRICVEGNLQTRSYDAQDGTKRHVAEVVVESVEFIKTKREENSTENSAVTTENTAEVDPYEEIGQGIELSPEDYPF